MPTDRDPFSAPVSDVGSTNSDLITRAQANEPAAWEQLVDLYAPLIYTWLRRAGASSEDSRDLVQDVLQAVSNHLRRFDQRRSEGSFRGWLWIITHNKLRDFQRRQFGLPAAPGGSAHALIVENIPAGTLSSFNDSSSPPRHIQDVRQALRVIQNDFKERTWQAFWLYAVEELDATEVGGLLEMSPTAVRLAKLRVLQRLKETLQ